MLEIIKKFNWIILSSIMCIFLGILTFLTFIDESIIPLTGQNLQILLLVDILLLVIFFYQIFKAILKLYNLNKKNNIGNKTNIKYISLFSFFTFIPSFLVAIFSLFIFSFVIQKYFDNKITKAVNNSYEVAKNYLEESKENVKSDIILMSVGLNRVSNYFYTNPKKLLDVIKAEKILRRIDDVYLIDSLGTILISDINDLQDNFLIPSEENFNESLNGAPVFISDNSLNKTSVMIKLSSLIDTYLLISRNIDPEILNYLNETERAVSFYYLVESKQTGIKITFAIIYIIVVTLLLFLSIVLAIGFATRLTKPIVNLIKASNKISKGELNTKVPESSSDEEFQLLNKNFNDMIDRLKRQQEKLLISERYEAWESIARKIAHEIKNPLTPIQLSIDRLREKYSSKIEGNSNEFENYLQTINRQIKDIENLVNEFSNFARMPRPIFKKIDLKKVLIRAINFSNMTFKTKVIFLTRKSNFFIKGDQEQLYRVFINLLKNSEESLTEKFSKSVNFKGKIEVEIQSNSDYIITYLQDNGTGISDKKKAMTPYFTTKAKGSGLGLPIVNKIINEHSGELNIKNNKEKNGVKIEITLPKYKN